MAQISFYAGENFTINNLTGSGLGFFGSAFGTSVEVGSFQDTTWITDGNGTIEGPQVDNVKWAHPNSGEVNGAAAINLDSVPNYLSTLKINFNHGTAVKTQNGKFRIFDRSSINNDPSGVTCYVAEIIHPNTTQTADGSGDASWTNVHGSAVILDLVDSPGESGLSPNGPSTTDTQHDFYLALSASPDSIGSKTQFGAYIELEYLIWGGALLMMLL